MLQTMLAMSEEKFSLSVLMPKYSVLLSISERHLHVHVYKASFTTAKWWDEPRWPSTEEWRRENAVQKHGEVYLAIQKNENRLCIGNG